MCSIIWLTCTMQMAFTRSHSTRTLSSWKTSSILRLVDLEWIWVTYTLNKRSMTRQSKCTTWLLTQLPNKIKTWNSKSRRMLALLWLNRRDLVKPLKSTRTSWMTRQILTLGSISLCVYMLLAREKRWEQCLKDCLWFLFLVWTRRSKRSYSKCRTSLISQLVKLILLRNTLKARSKRHSDTSLKLLSLLLHLLMRTLLMDMIIHARP